MLNGIVGRERTLDCQKALELALAKDLDSNAKIRVGYRGGNDLCSAKYNEYIWFVSDKFPNKFWNAFGSKLDRKNSNNIVVEINIPMEGVNLKVGQGIFAKDEAGSVFLLHGGGIGGGYPGVSKKPFLLWFEQYDRLMEVQVGKKRIKGILIGKLGDGEALARGVSHFLEKVDVFKRRARRAKGEAVGFSVVLNSNGKPNRLERVVTTYERNANISEQAKELAKGRCMLCKKKAPFEYAEGIPFLEAHHVTWLSKGGRDLLENTVALCPNCHRKMHYLDDPDDREKLRCIAKRQEALADSQ